MPKKKDHRGVRALGLVQGGPQTATAHRDPPTKPLWDDIMQTVSPYTSEEANQGSVGAMLLEQRSNSLSQVRIVRTHTDRQKEQDTQTSCHPQTRQKNIP